jgi:xanthine dehydrogenase molybdopterin-binding subunit B
MGGIVRRKEDPSLIQGRGVYVDDKKLSGELAVAFVRSPFAAGTIESIDTSAASALDGVVAVYTADDVRHLGPNLAQLAVGTLRPLLADGVVKHVGEAVAMASSTTTRARRSSTSRKPSRTRSRCMLTHRTRCSHGTAMLGGKASSTCRIRRLASKRPRRETTRSLSASIW